MLSGLPFGTGGFLSFRPKKARPFQWVPVTATAPAPREGRSGSDQNLIGNSNVNCPHEVLVLNWCVTATKLTLFFSNRLRIRVNPAANG